MSAFLTQNDDEITWRRLEHYIMVSNHMRGKQFEKEEDLRKNK